MSDSTQQKKLTPQQQKVEDLGPLYVWISQNVNVLTKLFVFTAALFAFPILTFFATLHTLFDGNTSYAGGAAALMANVIVILYVIVAMLERPRAEDDKKTIEKKSE